MQKSDATQIQKSDATQVLTFGTNIISEPVAESIKQIFDEGKHYSISYQPYSYGISGECILITKTHDGCITDTHIEQINTFGSDQTSTIPVLEQDYNVNEFTHDEQKLNYQSTIFPEWRKNQIKQMIGRPIRSIIHDETLLKWQK